jgi:hypothetical protein
MLVEAHVEASPVGMLWWADSFRSACSPGLWLAGGGPGAVGSQLSFGSLKRSNISGRWDCGLEFISYV